MNTTQVRKNSQELWVFPGQTPGNPAESQAPTYAHEHVDSVFGLPHIQISAVEQPVITALPRISRQDLEQSWRLTRATLVQLGWATRTAAMQNIKRIFDLSVALLALIAFSPFLLITAIAVRLESSGPIIFKQKRVGKLGKTFTCYKFRSMYQDAEARKAALMHLNEADQIVFKMKKDPRVTKVGRIIRKTSIDELPQIFNVIKGDMSLVGPRPPVPSEVEKYKFEHLRRLDVTPGITGLQQVSGRSTLDFKRWVELDVQYIQEYSFLKDIKILLMTVPAVITTRGAY
jgi:exopolysaccharide biosynthesis polyprenyl glycosylphosphotransferase